MVSKAIRLLLVDDHAVVRSGVRMMLGRAPDIEVAGEAETAFDALALVRKQEFDVALVDIAMEGKNGLDLLKALRIETPRIAVLMFSVYSEEVYAIRALRLGAAGYLTKSTDGNVIAEAVRKAAAGGRYISPPLVEKLALLIGGEKEPSHHALSLRELEVLKLIAQGVSLAEIAGRLHLSASTVTTYRARIVEKTGLRSNAEMARYSLENGLLV